MVKALFDTNILIDFFKGIPEAQIEFDEWPEKAISLQLDGDHGGRIRLTR